MLRKNVKVFILFLFAVLFIASIPTSTFAQTKEMIYIGGYDYVFAVDPETKDLTEIPVKGPVRGMTWTADGKLLYVTTNGRQTVEVIDTVKNEVIDEIHYTTDEHIGRIYGGTVDHEGKYLYMTVMRTVVDGVELKSLEPVIQVVDLETKEFVKDIEVPQGTHTLQMFTDGSKIAVWARNLYVYDIEKDELSLLEETGRVEDENKGISDYLYFWIRGEDTNNLSTVMNYKFYPETGEVTEGYIALDLETGDVDFIEFDEDPIGFFSGVITKDGKYSYGGMTYLVKTNLETLKHEKIVPTEAGSSYGFNISSDEKTIYVSGAGPDLSFYDTETLELIDMIELPSDTMDLRVIEIEQ